MLGGEVRRDARRLVVDDEVDAALPVQRDVLRPVIGDARPSSDTVAAPPNEGQETLTILPSDDDISSQLSVCSVFVCHTPVSPGPPEARVNTAVCSNRFGSRYSVFIVSVFPSSDRLNVSMLLSTFAIL